MTWPFVRAVREFDTLPSTSDTARELVVRGGIELPLLVLSHRQTAGRGRGEHAWWSGEGSLTFTVAIDPKVYGLKPEHESRVALAVAVAVCLAVEVDAWSPGIRWPNDVECEDRKLAGILPERVDTPEGPRLLIGVGLNVANRFEDAPRGIREMATSIAYEWRSMGGELEENAYYLDNLLRQIPTLLTRLAADDAKLAEEWRLRDVLFGREVRLKSLGVIVAGIGAGITPDGGLRIRVIGERPRVYYGGQVLRDRVS